MNRRKTVTKENLVDIEDEIRQKELLYAPVSQVYRDNQHLTDIQVDSISGIMSNIEIFKTWCPETSTLFEFTRLVCQNMQYEKFEKESAVFHIGEQGDKFYIILTGRAAVYIRRQVQQIEAEESAMLPKIEKMLEKLQVSAISEIPKENIMKFYEKLIKKQSKPVKQIEAELLLLNVGKFDMYFTENGICKFQQLSQSQIHSGLYFGDMALTTDKPRAASIISLTEVQALSLNKSNFKKIFEKQIKSQQEKIEYFLRMFPQMTKFKMSKLIMYFTQYKYPVNYTIWKQHDIVDGFFLLKEGEIQLQQTVDMKTIIKQDSNVMSPKREKMNQNETLTLAHITGGCFVGETDIYLQNERRDYTVKTMTCCNVFVLHLDSYVIVKKSFPEFIVPLQSIQMKNIGLYKKRLADIIQTKISNQNFGKKEEIRAIERRYVNEIEAKQNTQYSIQEILSPVLRSSMQAKMTKQEMVEQNQSIAEQHTKFDITTGKNEEFNMLKMAGENFQKCLLIRVEKQFEQFQPAKAKAKTPYFSKHQKDIRDLLEQIRRHQLPSLQQKEPIILNQQNEDEIMLTMPSLTMTKPQLRIINPLIQQKVEILKQCLSRQSHTTVSKSKSVSQTADQFYKIKAQQGFILCDSLFPYKPVHSTKNSNNKHYSNFKAFSRNKTSQQSQIQKISCPDINDEHFFSSQPTVQFS